MLRFTVVVLALCCAGAAYADADSRLAKALAYEARHRIMSPNGLVHEAVVDDADNLVELHSTSDCAIWTGAYVGAAALRFALYRDEDSRQALRRSVDGLHLLFQVTGVPGLFGRCAWRASDPIVVDETAVVHPGAAPFGEYLWRGRVSQDQLSGVLFGYALAYDFTDDEAVRAIIREDLGALARHVRENDLRIVDVDGEPANFTNFNPPTAEVFGIGIGGFAATMALSLFKTAAHVTGDPELEAFYRDELVGVRGFATLVDEQLHVEVPDALRALDAGAECDTNYNNYNMMFLVMLPLIRYEQDAQLASLYRGALRDHLWNDIGEPPVVFGFPLPGGPNNRPVRAQENSFWTYLYFLVGPDAPASDPAAIGGAERALDVFFAAPARGPIDVDNSAAYPSQCLDRFDNPMHKDSIIPMEQRVPGFFAWTGNPYSIIMGAPAREFSGVDYQVAYWLGRYTRLLAHPDADADGDGLDDDREPYFGADPGDFDSDDDGVADGIEVDVHHTDPTVADGAVGEGEGEGEGDGAVGEGEGEGDGVAGEGEGEGVVVGAEGEGEGGGGDGGGGPGGCSASASSPVSAVSALCLALLMGAMRRRASRATVQ